MKKISKKNAVKALSNFILSVSHLDRYDVTLKKGLLGWCIVIKTDGNFFTGVFMAHVLEFVYSYYDVADYDCVSVNDSVVIIDLNYIKI